MAVLKIKNENGEWVPVETQADLNGTIRYDASQSDLTQFEIEQAQKNLGLHNIDMRNPDFEGDGRKNIFYLNYNFPKQYYNLQQEYPVVIGGLSEGWEDGTGEFVSGFAVSTKGDIIANGLMLHYDRNPRYPNLDEGNQYEPVKWIYTSNSDESWWTSDKLGNEAIPTARGVAAYIAHELTCLAAGTPINMANGTYKNIEDIKPGDEVLSYDPATKQNVSTIVVAAYKTGETRNFTAYNFSNGKHLLAFNHHGIYSPKLGHPKSITDLQLREEVYDINLNKVRLMATQEIIISGERTNRYNILTLNNLYYANDILMGNRPTNKLHHFLDHRKELPEDIKAHWQLDADDYNNYNNMLNSAEYYEEIKEPFEKLAKARSLIKTNKRKLNNTDYKTQKRAENLLSDEEWEENTSNRAKWRSIINEQEPIYKANFEAVEQIRNKYRDANSPKTLFEKCCTRNQEIYDRVKEYFSNKKED